MPIIPEPGGLPGWSSAVDRHAGEAGAGACTSCQRGRSMEGEIRKRSTRVRVGSSTPIQYLLSMSDDCLASISPL